MLNLSLSQTQISLTLPAGRTIRGRVKANGAAATNTLVVAAAPGGRPRFATATADDGTYQFTSMPWGVFEVIASGANGCAPSFFKGVDLTEETAAEANLVLLFQ